jgi:hypothetical protein
MKNDGSIGSINRNKLIDCTELFSKSITKKGVTGRTSEIHNPRLSIQRTSSIVGNLNDTCEKSDSGIKQRRSKSRLRSLLARDFIE